LPQVGLSNVETFCAGRAKTVIEDFIQKRLAPLCSHCDKPLLGEAGPTHLACFTAQVQAAMAEHARGRYQEVGS
jgi:hypothetical protein